MQRPVLVGRNYGGGGRQGKFSRANQVFKDVPPPATLEERDEKSRSRFFFFYFIIDLKIMSLTFLDEINRKPG